MAVTDGMQHPAPQHTPINNLDPSLNPPPNAAIRAIVSLIWPYFSAAESAAFLLVDPEFRLRRNGGQVRVQVHGAAAREVALSKIGIGDAVELGLEGVSWVAQSPHVKTPGRCVAGELSFRKKLVLRIQRDGDPFASIDLDEPPSPVPQTASTPIRAPPTMAWRTPFGAAQSVEHKTPIRLSLDAHTSPADPFEDEEYELEERPRKRQRTTGLWRYERASQTPPGSPSAAPATEQEPSDATIDIPTATTLQRPAMPPVLPRIETETAAAPPSSDMSAARPRTPPSPYLKPVESAILPLISPLASFGKARETQSEGTAIKLDSSRVHEEPSQREPESAPYGTPSPLKPAVPQNDEEVEETVEEDEPPDFGLDGATMSRPGKHPVAASSPTRQPSRPGTPECDDRRIVQDTYQSQAAFSLRESQPLAVPDDSDPVPSTSSSGDRRSETPDTVREGTPQKLLSPEPAHDAGTLQDVPIPSSSPLQMLERSPTPPTQLRRQEPPQSSRRTVIIDLDADDDEQEAPAVPNAGADEEPTQTAHTSAAGVTPNPAHPSNLFGSQFSQSNGFFASSQTSNRSDWTDKTYVPNSESEGTDLEHPSSRAATPSSNHVHSGSATPYAVDTMDHDAMHTPTATPGPVSSPKLPSSAFSPFTSSSRETRTFGHEDALVSRDAELPSARDASENSRDETKYAIPAFISSPKPSSGFSQDRGSGDVRPQLAEAEGRGLDANIRQQALQPETSTAEAEIASLTDHSGAGSFGAEGTLDRPIPKTSPPLNLETHGDETGNGVSQAVTHDNLGLSHQPSTADYNREGADQINTPLERHSVGSAKEITPEASQTDPAQSTIRYPAWPHHRVDQILDGRMPPTPAPSAIPATMIEEQVEMSTLPEQNQDTAQLRANDDHQHTSTLGDGGSVEVVDEETIPRDQPPKTPLRKRINEVPEAISTWFSSGTKPTQAKAWPMVKKRGSQPRSSLGPTAKIRAPSAGFTFGTAPASTTTDREMTLPSIEPRNSETLPAGASTSNAILPQALMKAHERQVPRPQPQQLEGIRTETSYYTPLRSLESLLNRASQSPEATIDIFAIVSSPSSNPQRAKSGPKDYNTLLHVMDSSSPTSEVQAQIFRPFKLSLPIAETGDVILLRHFQVKSRLRRPFLLSGEGSAWHVWRYSRHEMQEDCRGPPVEIGDGEQEQAKKLRAWWVSMMDDANDDSTNNENQAREGTITEAGGGSTNDHAIKGGDQHPTAAVPPVR